MPNYAEAEEKLFAVTSVKDEIKGEKIVVLHIWYEEQIEKLLEQMKLSGLPNIYIPKKENFLRIRELPLLGSGKLNLKRLKDLAKEYFYSKHDFR